MYVFTQRNRLANQPQKYIASVSAAYGWKLDLGNEETLEKLLELNVERRSDTNDFTW